MTFVKLRLFCKIFTSRVRSKVGFIVKNKRLNETVKTGKEGKSGSGTEVGLYRPE